MLQQCSILSQNRQLNRGSRKWAMLSVVLCACTCYLSGAETNHQVSYKSVLCFSWAVAHHHPPAILLGQLTPESRGSRNVIHTLTCMHVYEPMRQCLPIIYTETSTHALMASVTEPIWLTFSSRQLQAFTSTACCILRGLVTVKSSPTTCTIYTNKLQTDLRVFCFSQYIQDPKNVCHINISACSIAVK